MSDGIALIDRLLTLERRSLKRKTPMKTRGITRIVTVIGVAVLLLTATGANAQQVPLVDEHTIARHTTVKLVAIGNTGDFVDMDPTTQLSYVAGAMQVWLSSVMYCTRPLTPQFVRDSMVAEVKSGYLFRFENFTITFQSTLARNGCHYEPSVMARLRVPRDRRE